MMNRAGVRKAALALVAMHSADRRWVLARLPAEWQNMLVSLVNEARSHTSLDPELLKAVLADEPTYLAREVPPPDVLIVVLDRLSPVWAARVLAAAAPDHADIYLAACDTSRAEAVRFELGRLPNPFPTALANALGSYLDDAARPGYSAGAMS